jgi:lysophospholipase L1-like esterase
LQPSLVLFCLFPGNDVTDAGLFDRWVKSGSQGNYLIRRFANDDDDALQSIRHVLRRSYLATFLRDAYTRLRAPPSFGRTIDFPDGGQLELVPAFYADLEREANPDHANFRMALDAVNQTRELAQRNGSEFLVVLVPTKEEVYLPLLDEEPPSAVAPFVERFEAAGIPYLDLTPGFQARARQDKRLFFKVDGHPNAAGYRLMADLILDHLRNSAPTYGAAGRQ